MEYKRERKRERERESCALVGASCFPCVGGIGNEGTDV